MATTKTKADNKAARKRAEFALKQFPKAKLKAAFERMSGVAAEADAASEAKALAALDVCVLAESFRDTNKADGAPCDVIAKGWSEHLKAVALDLAVSGNKFAELSKGEDGEADTAKLTGYGNNVASIARGVIELDVLLDALPEGVDGIEAGTPATSYRDVRKTVEAKRAEKRRENNPDAAMLADAKDLCREAAKSLMSAVFDTGDVELITSLAEAFEAMASDHAEAMAAVEEIEAEAEDGDEAEKQAA